MEFFDKYIPYLEELRRRIIQIASVFIILLFIGFYASRDIISVIREYFASENVVIIVTTPLEYLYTQMRVSTVFALVLVLPFLIFHFLGFVMPALKKDEKRAVLLTAPVSLFLFLSGCCTGLLLIRIFLAYLSVPAVYSGIYNYWSLGQLVTLVILICTFLGLIFQTPLMMILLAKLGIISNKWVSQKRKFVYLLAFIVSAVATPTVDPITQTIVAVPIIILFELGAVLMRIFK